MRQQINLYQPIFRQERKLFCAAMVASALLVITLALLGFWLFGHSRVAVLEQEVAQVRDQLHSQEAMVSAAGQLRSSRANPVEIQERIAQLNQELSDRTRALQVLRGDAIGLRGGFAPRLAALARQHVEGLWIDRLVLAGDAVMLSGQTLRAELVPQYLKSLASEPVLQGTRFDDFSIERPREDTAQSGVRFRAGNREMTMAATEPAR